ncbi:MAG: class II aldolase/adducin family protein [Clostridiales bacterium]|jgi:L-ribulose-5-phosphate 4-epimerase|nr:class II aldolase/adducin family protein [Clostridiales bacterium]
MPDIKSLNDVFKRLSSLGLADGLTIGIRTGDNAFSAVTPTANAADITEKDIIAVTLSDSLPDNKGALSILKTVYSLKPEAAAVITASPIYLSALSECAITIPPILDDFAQIIGPTLKTAEDTSKILAALKGRNGCMLKGSGVIVCGSSLTEAVTALIVAEKAAKTYVLSGFLSKPAPLPLWEAVLMNFIYKKKYSKTEEKAKAAPAAEPTVLTETQPRTLLAEYGRRLVKENLVQGTWGNISVRLDEKRMLVTPSGMDYMNLSPSDMVEVNIETLEYTGPLKPTSERKLHAAIYRARPEIGAVIHTHSEYCSIAAAARAELPSTPETVAVIGETLRCAAYGLPGTKKMTSATIAALANRNGCYLANHGAVVSAATLESAFDACKALELATKEYIEVSVVKKSDGKADIFSDELAIGLFKNI